MNKETMEQLGMRKLGSKVITVEEPKIFDWSEEGAKGRRWNARGKVVATSNSHGLCYQVKHKDGVKAWYAPEELYGVL